MSKNVQSTVLTSALAGLLAGAMVACGANDNPPAEPAAAAATEEAMTAKEDMEATAAEMKDDAEMAAADMTEGAQPAKITPHECKGMNECKGQGGCKVEGSHECKGHNECKGKGGCKVEA